MNGGGMQMAASMPTWGVGVSNHGDVEQPTLELHLAVKDDPVAGAVVGLLWAGLAAKNLRPERHVVVAENEQLFLLHCGRSNCRSWLGSATRLQSGLG